MGVGNTICHEEYNINVQINIDRNKTSVIDVYL